MNTIKQVALGSQGLTVSAQGLGCMGMSGFAGGTIYGATDDTESIATIHRALEFGVTMLDTADVYGPMHNEQLVGKAIVGKRDQFTIATKFGVQYFADELNVSPAYLSDMLRSLTGQNTQQHIHQALIEKAKRLLLLTSLTINETAYQLGFEYPPYFSRLFKNKTGLTPAEFRLSMQ